ncbi:MAG: ABC transporter substrate-binding protein [Lachnospiraceae bacterium]|nr:ABC transporter substrate-binding protein [Lachnospiraceae bacterium]
MKKSKKILALALVSAMALTACGGGEKAEETKAAETTAAAEATTAAAIEENKGEVGTADAAVEYEESAIIGYWFDLDTADPYGSTTAAQQFFTNFTFDTVTFNNPDTGEIEPRLAKEWKDVNGDGLVWDFTLQEGVKFHNGNDFTAEDVKFTWEYTASSAGNVIRTNTSAGYVESIEAVDDLTVRFNLTTPMFDWPSYMETKMYDKESFDAMDPTEAGVIGTGPYKYDKSLHVSGVEFVAVRNEDYWQGLDNYPTKNIVFKVLLDDDTRVAALQSGDVDMIFNVTASYYDILKGDSNVEILTRGGANSYYMGFNHRKSDMADLEVRKALAMAINREDIEAISFNNGVGGKANYNFCVESGAGYAAVEPIGYDPDAAMAKLKELGKENMSLVLGHTSSTKAIAEVIQANMMLINVDVELRQVDASNWTAFKKADEYDLFTDYCAYQGALLYNFNRFFQSAGSSNMFGYASDEYDAKEQEVLTAGSYEAMVEKFGELQQLVADILPVVPVASGNQIAAMKPDVEGITLAPSTNYMNFSTIRIPKRQ